jgi:MoaA/NifB/PqqE/SkfB family radical SAM enzyme
MIRLSTLLPKLFRYRLAYHGLTTPGPPLNLTFSVTNLCQSRCRTCRIWELYQVDHDKRHEELSLSEIEQIFASIGRVDIFNVSGGEPFLRNDLGEIVRLACEYLAPGVVHIPTNALAVAKVERGVREILGILEKQQHLIQLTVKPSLDHIGAKHDAVRGVPGNFKKVITVFGQLKKLQRYYSNLHVELGTVISVWNIDAIEEISSYIASLEPDSYRNEIAEQRSEMFNMDEAITPNAEQYEQAIARFMAQSRNAEKARPLFQRINHAFRLAYYDLAVRILREKRQVLPCYAGISNVHLSAYGDLWPCCTLGYGKSMGNLRDFGYNYLDLLQGEQARAVLDSIHAGECHCPLANQAYSNQLMHMPSLIRVIREIARKREQAG